MYIRQINVDNFGSIRHFEKSLSSYPTVIKSNDPGTVLIGISLLLESKYPYSVPHASLVGQNTRLYAEIVTNDGFFCVEKVHDRNHTLKTKTTRRGKAGNVYEQYQAFMQRSHEEDDICFFDTSKKPLIPNRIFRYLYEDKFYFPGEFGKLTNGLGTTKTFRTYLKNYIGKDSLLLEMGADPLAAEKGISPFREFLDVACFWDGFCKIRDLHYEGKPLLVANPQTNLRKSLSLFLNVERQILIFSDTDCTNSKELQK